MFEELSDILRERVSPEVLTAMTELTAALERHDAVMYKDRINQLRMESNNIDRTILTDEAIAIVFGQVNALLQQMQIQLNVEEMRISRIAEFISVLTFDPSDDDDEILRVIEGGDAPEDIFLEIMAIKLNCLPEEIMDCVLAVSGHVIDAIKDKVQQNLRATDHAIEGVQDTVRMVNAHTALLGKNTIGMESLNSGNGFVNIDPQVIIDSRREELLAMDTAELGDQIMSICIIGGADINALQGEVMEYVESILHDPIAIQKVYRHVTKQVAELRKNHEEA